MPSSSPPPPSYSSRNPPSRSPSQKLSHGVALRDKDKDKNNEKTNLTEKLTIRDGDDAVSIQSKSSSAFSTRTTSSTQSTMDTLKLIAGSGVRRSKCRAEFLEELANAPDRLAALDKDVADRLSIITGKEGVAFFRKFIGDEPLESGIASEKEKKRMKKSLEDPVVFAVCVMEAGRKVVDYYMTWRGKARAKELSGSQRREGLLDDEFRRVRKEIDKSYRRQGGSNDNKDNSHSRKLEKPNEHHPTPPPRKRTSVPPNIIVSSHDKIVDTSSPTTPRAKRPASANDSVISLPFLGAIRNVPLSNRLPLRVTNPDRNSFADSPVVEDQVAQIPINVSLETLVEAVESAEPAENDPERQASVDTLVQASDADQKLDIPKEKPRKRYAESVSSAGSRSSKSSRSKIHAHSKDPSRSRRGSSSRKHSELSRSRSERTERGHSHSSTSRPKNKEDDKYSSRRKHSRSSRHRGSSRHRDERNGTDNKDSSSRKPDRKTSTRHKPPLSSDITVVVVDPEEVDRVSNQEPPPATSSKAWHGFTLTRRATKPSPAVVKTPSPWSGPLARASDGVRNIAPYLLEPDSDDEYWEGVPRNPVIPSRSNSSNDSDGSLSSGPRVCDSPRTLDECTSSEPETQAIYPRGFNPHASPPAHAYTPSLHAVVPRGVPPTPKVSPYTYGSPSTNHSSSPFVGIVNPPSSGTYTPGYAPTPSLCVTSPTNLSNNSLPFNSGYIPGFVPTHFIPTVGSNTATPLSGMHHSLTDPTLLQVHGSNSPFLYSSPRAGVGSPYVPAWVSPNGGMGAALPGSLTPASARGVPLHAGAGGYSASTRATAPY